MFGLRLDRLKSMSSGLMPGGVGPIALDFGASGIKALQVVTGDPPTLVAAAFLPTPENLLGEANKRLAWQLEHLPELVKSAGFRGRRAVCGIPTAQAYCKHLQVPAGEPREMASMVRGALAMQLNCAPEAIVCRHIEVGPAASGGGKVEIIGMAASRAMVDRLMGAMRSARLEPVGLHPEFIAVLRSFDHVTRRAADADATSLYLDLGRGSTRVLIAHGTQLVFAKTVSIGGQYLDEMVARQLKLDIESAHKERISCSALTPAARSAAAATAAAVKAEAAAAAVKPEGDGMALLRAAMTQTAAGKGQAAGGARAGGGGDAADGPVGGGKGGDSAVAEEERRTGMPAKGHTPIGRGLPTPVGPSIDLHEPLDAVTDEITMCLRYHDSLFPGRRLTRTIFIGGESRHVALCQHVARVLKAPASVADPLARLARTGSEPLKQLTLSEPQPGWAATLGLCLCPTDL